MINLKVFGTKQVQSEFNKLARKALTPARVRQIMKKAAKPLLLKARQNARMLSNDGAIQSVKTRRFRRGGKYKPGKDFARAIMVKTPVRKRSFMITIGPSQKKLNLGKKVKWKGRDVPMAHWKEFGTTARTGQKHGRIKGGFAVWRAQKKLRKITQRLIERGILNQLSKYTNTNMRYLRFTNV